MIEKVNPSHPDKVADRIAGALGLQSKQVGIKVISGFGLALGIIEVIVMTIYMASF